MIVFATSLSRRLKSATRALFERHEEKASHSFVKDESGAIAIIFAVAIIPIILMLGAAVDYGRIALDRAEVQDALDAATLATVKKVAVLSDDEVRSMVEAYANANLPSGLNINVDHLEIERNPSAIKAWATGSTETTFMHAAGIDSVDFRANSRAVSTDKSIELVMVLDNSGSMRYDMNTLYDASVKLVDTLEANQQAVDDLSIGVVPFNHLVRLDAGHDKATWIDQKAKSSVHRKNLPPKSKRMNLFKTLRDPVDGKPEKWEGCVEARAHPYDIKDTTPNSSYADSYFVPYFYPDTREPNNQLPSSYYASKNDYLPGNPTTT